ncbi:MAG: hypothetical protein ACMXX6_01520 [Candidatus Woesearchaeota archaeon]
MKKNHKLNLTDRFNLYLDFRPELSYKSNLKKDYGRVNHISFDEVKNSFVKTNYFVSNKKGLAALKIFCEEKNWSNIFNHFLLDLKLNSNIAKNNIALFENQKIFKIPIFDFNKNSYSYKILSSNKKSSFSPDFIEIFLEQMFLLENFIADINSFKKVGEEYFATNFDFVLSLSRSEKLQLLDLIFELNNKSVQSSSQLIEKFFKVTNIDLEKYLILEKYSDLFLDIMLKNNLSYKKYLIAKVLYHLSLLGLFDNIKIVLKIEKIIKNPKFLDVNIEKKPLLEDLKNIYSKSYNKILVLFTLVLFSLITIASFVLLGFSKLFSLLIFILFLILVLSTIILYKK